MSEVLFKPYTILSADIGNNNPMADIKNVEYIHAGHEVTDRINSEEKKYIGKGMISTILPYMLQDNYNRERRPKDYNAVILENKHLRAVFLPELGGRLWSLYHKGLKKELLYKNSVFQPGNLAIRNAWFSGGVEWNACIKGHSPFTCSPLFAQKITYEDKSFGLRMYEYERIRNVVFSIEAWLPEDSEMLYVRPRIENTSKEEKYMYWWSNIAVPENEGARTIVPANESFICYYNEGNYVLDSDIYPDSLGTDASYPENLKRSLDFFYKVPDNEEKWIAAVEKDGTGLLQCSTKEQIGRKLFVWGRGKGGKNWNEFLSTEGEAYIEIQAGLARTQLEHIPMSGETVWEWVEAYGAAVCDPKESHNSDWDIAQNSVVKNLHRHFPCGIDRALREEGIRKKIASDEKIMQMGSGWGYLASIERDKTGRSPISNICTFPKESVDEEQRDWLDLIEKGYIAKRSSNVPPESYIVTPFWRNLLKKSVNTGKSDHWYGLLQLGVMEYAAGNLKQALEYWEKSIDHDKNVWAYRNIAMLYKNEYSDMKKAREYIVNAIALDNSCRSLVVDCANVLIAAQAYEEWLAVFDRMPDYLQKDGRLLLFKSISLMKLDRYEEASSIVNPEFEMFDIKEGEVSISQVWYELYSELIKRRTGETNYEKLMTAVEELYPLGKLDFRMHA